MALELREAPPPAPDVADRRVLDAQVLYSLKNYEEAATILLDVVEKYPNTRATTTRWCCWASRCSRRATSIRRATTCRRRSPRTRDRSRSSRRCSGWSRSRCAPATSTTSIRYLTRLQNLPPALMEPATPYVRGKYYFYPQPARRRGAGVRVDPADQPLLLPVAVLPGHDRGQEGRPGGRDPGLRRAPEDAGARRGQQGRPGPEPAGDRAHPLRAIAVRQGDRGLPVDPAPVEVLARRAARAGLDVHQGQGLAARLPLGEPAAARRSGRAATVPTCASWRGTCSCA